MSQLAHQAGAYPDFHRMMQLVVFLLSPALVSSPSQGYCQHLKILPIIQMGGERHCESEVPYPRTQHNAPSQGLNTDHSVH